MSRAASGCQRTAAAFRAIMLGRLRLTPENYCERAAAKVQSGNWDRPSPRAPLDRDQIGRLRTMLSRAGVDPVKVGGLPPLKRPKFRAPPDSTYDQACREFKQVPLTLTLPPAHPQLGTSL